MKAGDIEERDGHTFILTDRDMFYGRKAWRERRWLNNCLFFGLEIFPPKVPLHNLMTYRRKQWSQSRRLYQYYDQTFSAGKACPVE